MGDENLVRFGSRDVQQRNAEFVKQLKSQLDDWRRESYELIEGIVKQANEEIDQYYEQYRHQMEQEYQRIDEEHQSNLPPSNIDDRIKAFNEASTVKQCIRLRIESCKRAQFADNVQVEYDQIRIPSSEQRTPKKVTPRKVTHPESPPYKSPYEPSAPKTPSPEKVEPIPKKNDPIHTRPRTRSPSPNGYPIRKSETRLYIGRHDAFVPVLIGTDREVSNETEQTTEYSIDSLPISQSKQYQREQSFHLNPEDDITLVRAYKDLINDEDDHYQISSGSVSDADEEGSSGAAFSLRQFNKNYSTIMFRNCETELNCMASSTKQNEIIVYNSKLNVLIILQHENEQPFRHRFFVQWPDKISPNVSDITYCNENDQYIISTWDDNHLYMLNRNLLSLTDLGQLKVNKPLRRIHCYERTLYCISHDAFLDEYQFDEHFSNVEHIARVELYGATHGARRDANYLLDVAADEQFLAVLCAKYQDEIHLELYDRRTQRFIQDLKVDNVNPIKEFCIRLEGRSSGTFVYVNGEQKHLKSIDFDKYRKGKVTWTMPRNGQPTNVCFLPTGRLVVLYGYKHFLAIHELKHPQSNEL